MKIRKINFLNLEEKILEEAADCIRRGGVVVFPTETSYGLAVDPRNSKAVKKLFRIKGRAASKTLSLIAADTKMVTTVATLSATEKKLAQDFWPGALTLILTPKKNLPRHVRSAIGVAIRVSGNSFARSLAAAYKFPLTATSANYSTKPATYSLAQFQQQFREHNHQPDLFLNAGRLPKRRASTLAIIRQGSVTILRPGPITLSQLTRVIH